MLKRAAKHQVLLLKGKETAGGWTKSLITCTPVIMSPHGDRSSIWLHFVFKRGTVPAPKQLQFKTGKTKSIFIWPRPTRCVEEPRSRVQVPWPYKISTDVDVNPHPPFIPTCNSVTWSSGLLPKAVGSSCTTQQRYSLELEICMEENPKVLCVC